MASTLRIKLTPVSRGWFIPLAAPGALAAIGLAFWLYRMGFGAQRHGLFLGHGFISTGLPSAYFLAYGLLGARRAGTLGSRRNALAVASLAIAATVLLFIAVYPAPPTGKPDLVSRAYDLNPLGLITGIGLLSGFIAFLPNFAIGMALRPILGDGATIVTVTMTLAIGAACAGALAGGVLAMVEARGQRAPGRLGGHVRWLSLAAVVVALAARIPIFPVSVLLAVSGLALHAWNSPPLQEGGEGGGLPVALCHALLAWTAYVALLTGPGRFAAQYVTYVP